MLGASPMSPMLMKQMLRLSCIFSLCMATSNSENKLKVSNTQFVISGLPLIPLQPSPLRSIIAGSTAGAVEIGMLALQCDLILLILILHSHHIPSRVYVYGLRSLRP